MDYKKEYIRLVNSVKEKRKELKEPYRNEDIARVLGYSRTYFSELLGKTGKVTIDHVKQIKLNFPYLSDKPTNTGMSNQEASQRMYEMILANNALTKVLKAEIVALKSSVTGKSISSVNLQIEADAKDQLAHDLKEYEKHSG